MRLTALGLSDGPVCTLKYGSSALTAGTVGVGTPGEILVRGPHVATGYWDPNVAAAIPFTDGWFAER